MWKVLSEYAARFGICNWIMAFGVVILLAAIIYRAVLYRRRPKGEQELVMDIRGNKLTGSKDEEVDIKTVKAIIAYMSDMDDGYKLLLECQGARFPEIIVDEPSRGRIRAFVRRYQRADMMQEIAVYIFATCLLVYTISWFLFLMTANPR
jgi:hypothetical protein